MRTAIVRVRISSSLRPLHEVVSIVTTLAELFELLDSVPETEWEREYSTRPVTVDQANLRAALEAKRLSAGWLVFRLCAGPPGTPLPDIEQSIKAIIDGCGGAAEAYVAMFHAPALPADKVCFGLLNNAAYSALRGKAGTLFAYLASRSGLAWLIAGEPERAWSWLDVEKATNPMPWFEDIRCLVELRSTPVVLDPWFRRAVWARWPLAPPKAVPDLPVPEADDACLPTFTALLHEFAPTGASRALIDDGLRRFCRWRASQIESHPSVSAIRIAALNGDDAPPERLELPEEFADWVRAEMASGHHEAARLGALAAHATGKLSTTSVFFCVAGAARIADIERLRQTSPGEAMTNLLAEVAELLPRVPDSLKNLFFWALLPVHYRSAEGVLGLRANIASFATITRRAGGVVDEFLRGVAQLPDPSVSDGGELAPLAIARSWVRGRIRDEQKLTGDELRALVAQAPLVPPGPALLDPIEGPDPIRSLIDALLGLRAHQSQNEATRSLAVISLLNAAQRAIFESRIRSLFPLRLELLQELLALVHQDADFASVMMQLASTRNSLEMDTAQDVSVTLTMFEGAASMAERSGDLACLTDATAAWAKTIARGVSDGQLGRDRVAEAQTRIDVLRRAHPGGRTGWRLRWAEAVLYTFRGAGGEPARFDLALAAMRDVLAAMPADDPFRGDALGELAHVLVNMGEFEEALANARHALASATPGMGPAERGFLHHALAECLQCTADLLGAATHYREAVRLIEGVRSGALPRIRLAAVLIEIEQLGEAQDLLERLREKRGVLRREDQVDLAHVLVALGSRLHNVLLVDRALLDVESVVCGTQWEASLRIEHAMAQGRLTAFADAIAAYLDGRWPKSPDADQIIEREGWNAADAMPNGVQLRMLEWAKSRGHVALQARMLEVLGDGREATRLLQSHLRSSLARDQRLQALYLLLGMMGRAEPSQIRTITDEIESIRGTDADNPRSATLADLAQGLRLGADGDRTRLERAFSLAKSVAQGKGEARTRKFAVDVACRAVLDQLVATNGVSSPDNAASTLRLIALPASVEVLGPFRTEAARLLLLVGPIAHPEAIEVAMELLAGVPRSDEVAALMDRADSMRALSVGSETSIVRVRGRIADPGALDATATWLVALVAGRETVLDARQVLDSLAPLQTVVAIRPDRADAILSAIFPIAIALRPRERDLVLDIFCRLVNAGEQSTEAWPVLQALLAPFETTTTDRRIHRLRGAVNRSRMVTDGEGGPVARLADLMDMPRDLPIKDELEWRFERGVLALKSLAVAPSSPEAGAWRSLAADDLQFVVRKATTGELRWHATVSLGNAYRHQEPPAFGDAFRCYDDAERTAASTQGDLGKLHKVWSDGLRERGSADDMRAAWQHIEIALTHRTEGWDRMETLWSAAEIAAKHPDRDEHARGRQTVELLAQSMLVYPKRAGEVAHRLLHALGGWAVRPDERVAFDTLLDRVAAAFPPVRDDLDRAKLGGLASIGALELRWVKWMMASPDLRFVIQTRNRLRSAAEIQNHAARNRFPALRDDIAAVLRKVEHQPIVEVGSLRALMGEIARAVDAPVGKLIARAEVLHALARLEDSSIEKVRSATENARIAIAAVADGETRAWLLSTLSDVWNGRYPHGDPLCDMDLVADLAVEAITASGGEASAHRDILEHRARALRYRQGGDLSDNLRQAHRLYLEILRRDEEAKHSASIGNTLNSLGDIEGQIGEGTRMDRLQRSAARHRRAVSFATTEADSCQYRCNLAWTMTQYAPSLPLNEGLSTLREALVLFDTGDRRQLKEFGSHAFENERIVCASLVARLSGDRDGDIQIWRGRLSGLDRVGEPDQWSLACHNLANALLSGVATEAERSEALRLGSLALAVRTLEYDPRFHWETHVVLAESGRTSVGFGVGSMDAGEWARCREHFRCALKAAAVLGEGDELVRVGEGLLRLAVRAPSERDLHATAEEGWEAVNRAAPKLLLDDRSARNQAVAAIQMAFAAADAQRGSVIKLPMGPGVSAITGDRAGRVLRWLVRAGQPFHRLREGLNTPPVGAATEPWMMWRNAVLARQEAPMLEALAAIHSTAPHWLRSEAELTHTWKWLAEVPGSIAIAVFPGRSNVLVAVLDGDNRRSAVLVLPMEELPFPESTLADSLRDASLAESLLPELTNWLREGVVAPFIRFHGKLPKRVLWCVQGALRLIPPGPLWPGVPVSVAASVALAPTASVRTRSDSLTLFYADPRSEQASLGTAGVRALALLATADPRARIVAGAVGKRADELHPAAQPVSASAAQLGREIEHAGRIVVLAHGCVEGHQNAWISCVVADGSSDPLHATNMASNPGSLAGLSAVLLSCETGRTGDHSAFPGGIAGVLLTAGAAEVIAPLFPVELDAASEVGAAILRGAREGVPADVVLASLGSGDGRGGPTLGPAPSLAHQRAQRGWNASAFVRMIG